MRRTKSQRQRLTNKPSTLLLAGSLLSIGICSGLLWIYLNHSPQSSIASPDDIPPPALEFEIKNFVQVDSLNLRTASSIPALPLKAKKKSPLSEKGTKNEN